MTWKRIIRPMEQIPNALYGVAYYEPLWCQWAYYPIPFNFVVRWSLSIRNWWNRTRSRGAPIIFMSSDALSSWQQTQYHNGYRIGYKDGYDKYGTEYGTDLAWVQETLERWLRKGD